MANPNDLTPAACVARIEREMWRMLIAMAVLLAVFAVACRPARVARDAERDHPSKISTTAAPLGAGNYDWSYAD